MGKTRLANQEMGECFDPIRIRAHHLLCIQGFQGYGYDRYFEEHMKNVFHYFFSNPKNKLQIIVANDEICSHCPHEVGNQCIRDSDVSNIGKLNQTVIDRAFLTENTFYSFENAVNSVNNNLKNDDILEICGECGWSLKCLFFIQKMGK